MWREVNLLHKWLLRIELWGYEGYTTPYSALSWLEYEGSVNVWERRGDKVGWWDVMRLNEGVSHWEPGLWKYQTLSKLNAHICHIYSPRDKMLCDLKALISLIYTKQFPNFAFPESFTYYSEWKPPAEVTGLCLHFMKPFHQCIETHC